MNVLPVWWDSGLYWCKRDIPLHILAKKWHSIGEILKLYYVRSTSTTLWPGESKLDMATLFNSVRICQTHRPSSPEADKCSNWMHARWFSFLQRFVFTIQHRDEHQNKVADALSQKSSLLTILHNWETIFEHFEHMKDLYDKAEDFVKSGITGPHFRRLPITRDSFFILWLKIMHPKVFGQKFRIILIHEILRVWNS